MAENSHLGGRSGGGAWGAPVGRFDAAWQRIESRLCAAVLVAEIASLTLWVSLKGLSSDFTPGGNAGGLVYRCVVTAAFLGACAHRITRERSPGFHRTAVAVAMSIGFAAGPLWEHAAVGWSSNVLNWLQNSSALMLIGGLRGLATRLTLWLTLLGASLATSRGRHIHVDVLARLLPPRVRAAMAIVGLLAASAVCTAGVFGFVDYISIAQYRARAVAPCPGDAGGSCDTTSAEKIATMGRVMSSDFFLLGRQVSLDLRSLPRVLAGRPYDQWMTAEAWNEWLEGADWTAHFDKWAVDALRLDTSSPSAMRMPQVAVPGTGEEARGLLIRELNFIFPFGLAIMAIKLVLRALLVIARRVDRDAPVAP